MRNDFAAAKSKALELNIDGAASANSVGELVSASHKP
jgi:hypothetical protein